MSSSGWGGPENGPQGDPRQNGAPQHGAPQHNGPQNGQPQGGPQAPGWGGPQAPGWGGPQGPGQPQNAWGPGAPQDPRAYGTSGGQPQRKRPWVLIGVALTCVLALLLVVGGGITFVLLSRDGGTGTAGGPTETSAPAETPTSEEPETPSETPSPTPEEPEDEDFEVVVPYDPPTGSADVLWDVMEDNPLTSGTLPAVAECDLPATPIEPSKKELQAVLDAASTCLNQIWSTASSDRGLPWTSPKIVVYEHPDVPDSAVCDSNFSADFPRMCNLDSTLYWPIGYGTATHLSHPDNVPGAYLWDLSYVYTNTVTWNSSLAVYYQTLRKKLEGSDEARYDQAWRAFALQRECFASAAAMQVPGAAEPSAALREKLIDPGTWKEGEPPESVTPENRAAWIERGFTSGGDLSQCNTWVADADQVA